jgi:hypothetical protein
MPKREPKVEQEQVERKPVSFKLCDHYCHKDKHEAMQLASELKMKCWMYTYKGLGKKHTGYVIAKNLATAKLYFENATLKEQK